MSRQPASRVAFLVPKVQLRNERPRSCDFPGFQVLLGIRAALLLGGLAASWLLACTGQAWPAEVGQPGEPRELTPEQRVAGDGLNPEGCLWRCRLIAPSGKPREIRLDEDAVKRYGRSQQPALGAEPAVAAFRAFRKDFTLGTPVRRAELAVAPHGGSGFAWMRVLINGQTAFESPAGQAICLKHLDITRLLHPGHNVIAVLEDFLSGHHDVPFLMADAMIYGTDGSILQLGSGESWRAGWNPPPDWELPATDPAAMPVCRVGVDAAAILPNGAQGTSFGPRGQGATNPPYMGPIRVERPGGRESIFDAREPIRLELTLWNQRPLSASPRLTYELVDEFTRRVVADGELPLVSRDTLDLAAVFSRGPLPPAPYRLRLVLTRDGEPLRRDYELAVVGPIPQRVVEGSSFEDGMDLKPIWNVDCTEEPRPGEFITGDHLGKVAATKVVQGPAGRCRELAQRNFSHFGYRFRVQRLYVPHLAVVEWPDDAPRRLQVEIMEGTSFWQKAMWAVQGYGFVRGTAGVTCLPEHPRTNRMQKLHVLYWPNEFAESVHVMNADGEAPAAAARIRVYEITNGLPAIRLADAGQRWLGVHTERGPHNAAHTFYAGPLGAKFAHHLNATDYPEFYRGWYNLTANMIKRMRFSGENLVVMGQFMYQGTLYPSARCPETAYGLSWAGDALRDYGGLMGRMLAANGMAFLSGVEYGFTRDLLDQGAYLTPEQIKGGASTVFCVGDDGHTARAHVGQGVNYLHPKVQESLLTVCDELIALNRDNPGWKGLALIASGHFAIGVPAGYPADVLKWGYEDFSIDLFQRQTGVRLPVDPRDPERFAKRRSWLEANAWEKFLQWRCDEFSKLYLRLRDHVVQARPDAQLYVFFGEPYVYHRNQLFARLAGKTEDAEALRAVYRAFGVDVPRLKREPGIVMSPFHFALGGFYLRRGRNPHWNVPAALTRSEPFSDLWGNDGRGGAYLHIGFTEYSWRLPKGQWLFDFAEPWTCYLWPPGDYFADTWTNMLVRSNPTLIAHTWLDSNMHGGHEHELRQFARAYRSLPNGKYRRLTGEGRDAGVWIAQCAWREAQYVYAANVEHMPLDVELVFPRGTTVRDLLRDQPVPLADWRWRFRLGPYGIQSLRVEGAGAGDAVAAAAARR